jgi:hypothetical protein
MLLHINDNTMRTLAETARTEDAALIINEKRLDNYLDRMAWMVMPWPSGYLLTILDVVQYWTESDLAWEYY